MQKTLIFHSTAISILNKSEEIVKNTTAASKYIPRRPKISINWNPPFQTQIYLVNSKKWKISKIFESLRNFFFALQYLKNWTKVVSWKKIFCSWKKNFVSLKKISFEFLCSEVWKGGFQLMLILGLLGMYFDAAVVFVTISSLSFRIAMAMLCSVPDSASRKWLIYVSSDYKRNLTVS